MGKTVVTLHGVPSSALVGNTFLEVSALNILDVSGTKSGRDTDKIAELGLTLENPAVTSVPGIKELPLTLECRIIYRQMQNPQAISEENHTRFYPQDVPSSFYGANRDYHEAYYGEIVAAYMIK